MPHFLTNAGRRAVTAVLLSTVSLAVFTTATWAQSNKTASEPVTPAPIRGRVVDPENRPAVDAHVAIVGRSKERSRGGDYPTKRRTLAMSTTNAEGRFSLPAEGINAESYDELDVIAGTAGFGIVWQALPDDSASEIVLPLKKEEVVRVRLLDVEGRPAAGVKVRIERLTERGKLKRPWNSGPDVDKPTPAWPKEAVTDQEGRFDIRGVAAGCGIDLKVEGERFAPQSLGVNTGQPERRPANDGTYRAQFRSAPPGGEAQFVLAPAQIFEGVVRFADTKQPAPLARIVVWSTQGGSGSSISLSGTADDQGHYRISANPGTEFRVSVYPPEGSPYLARSWGSFKWPGGLEPHALDLDLPKGILMKGAIQEAGTGLPEPQASIQYIPRDETLKLFGDELLTGWQGIQLSKPDGTFEFAVPPGHGTLLFHGRKGRFVLHEIGDRQMRFDRPGGMRNYAHAIVPINPTGDSQPAPLKVELGPAVSVSGHLVDQAGQPIPAARILTRLDIAPLTSRWQTSQIGPTELQGKFVLEGLTSGKQETVHFLDPKQRLGATATLSAADQGQTIVLAPCGTAKLKVVNSKAEPVVGFTPNLEFIMTPGPSISDPSVPKTGALVADSTYVVNVDLTNYRPAPKTSDDGMIIYPALIPGASYRIEGVKMGRRVVERDFVAESGKELDLGEIVMDVPERLR